MESDKGLTEEVTLFAMTKPSKATWATACRKGAVEEVSPVDKGLTEEVALFAVTKPSKATWVIACTEGMERKRILSRQGSGSSPNPNTA